jgi:hypothetical protein
MFGFCQCDSFAKIEMRQRIILKRGDECEREEEEEEEEEKEVNLIIIPEFNQGKIQ